MTKQDVVAYIPLKTNWFHILLSLAAGEQHGYGIMQDVLEQTTGKLRLWPATLYGAIKRLIEAGLIERTAGAGGRRRPPPLLPANPSRPPGARCRVRPSE